MKTKIFDAMISACFAMSGMIILIGFAFGVAMLIYWLSPLSLSLAFWIGLILAIGVIEFIKSMIKG